MKPLLSLFLFVAGISLGFGHNRSFPLDEGEVILGVQPGGSSGLDNVPRFGYSGGEVDQVVVNVLSYNNTALWMGDSFSVEYGLSDTFALGVKTGFLNMVMSGLGSGDWDLQLAGFSALDLGRTWLAFPFLGLFWNEMVQIDRCSPTGPPRPLGSSPSTPALAPI